MTEPAATRSDLAQRYAAPPPWRRRVIIGAVVVLAVVFVGWVAWVAWDYATPPVQSELTGFEVTDDGAAQAEVLVELDDGVVASCRVTAYAEDRTTVGEVSFTPVQGLNEVTIRTDRLASSVEMVGCSTSDEPRPR